MSARQIRETVAKSTVWIENDDGSKTRRKIPKATANYLLMPEELWARSYAQYIAGKTKDPKLMSALLHNRSSSEEARLHMPPQWYDKDFETNGTEIEKILKLKGWRS